MVKREPDAGRLWFFPLFGVVLGLGLVLVWLGPLRPSGAPPGPASTAVVVALALLLPVLFTAISV